MLIAAASSPPPVPPLGAPPGYLIDYQKGQASQRNVLTVGGVLLGTGVGAIVAGAFLIRRGKTLVTIARPSSAAEPAPP